MGAGGPAGAGPLAAAAAAAMEGETASASPRLTASARRDSAESTPTIWMPASMPLARRARRLPMLPSPTINSFMAVRSFCGYARPEPVPGPS